MVKRKLSDILREEEERGKQVSESKRKEANQQFNEITDKQGSYDTTKQYTTIGELREAYKGHDNYNNIKESTNTIYNKNRERNSLWDKVKFIAQRTGNEVLGGITSVGEAGTQTVANNLQKGKKQNFLDMTQKNIGNLLDITNPIAMTNKVFQNATKDTLRNLFSDKSIKEKLVNQGLNAVSNAQNIVPGKNLVDTSVQMVGKILPEQASNDVLKLGDEISKPYYYNNEKLNEESEKFGSGTNLAADVFGTVGRMIPAIAGTGITKNPYVGLRNYGDRCERKCD